MTRLIAFLIAANLAAWGLATAAFHGNTVLMGAAFLAYMLGCRHAVDADHIAAIDNATRRLSACGHRPATTGLYFSLGHSAVVWLASVGIALAASAAGPQFATLRSIGGLLGTSVSVLFLLGLAAANLLVLKGILAAIRRQKQGETVTHEHIDAVLAPRGFTAWLLKPVFRMVSKSRHMFAVGVLFGLGFDTATEIGVLGISAAAASGGLPIWTILIFPALFTAGMSLIDTLDSALMAGAYGWAFVEPARKLYYNLTVTFLSVVVALVVGGIELMTMIPANAWTSALSGAQGWLGIAVIALFAVLWLGWSLRRRARG
jgi:high-affinity nickel-transport protein